MELTDSDSDVIFQPIDRADVELRVPNIDKAKELLNYEPKINLKEGLLRTIEWYRNQL